MRYTIPDPSNPDRGYCIIGGCCNLRRNKGGKKWGKYCFSHHLTPAAITARKERKVKARAETAIRRSLRMKELRELGATKRAAMRVKRKKERDVRALLPRVCTRCCEIKPCDDFNGKFGVICKTCKTNNARERIWANKYGITNEEYRVLLLVQGGNCAICGNSPNGRGLVIDHCHTTGQVRGLLCTTCNAGIGCLRDNLDLLASASSYLTNSRLGACG